MRPERAPEISAICEGVESSFSADKGLAPTHMVYTSVNLAARLTGLAYIIHAKPRVGLVITAKLGSQVFSSIHRSSMITHVCHGINSRVNPPSTAANTNTIAAAPTTKNRHIQSSSYHQQSRHRRCNRLASPYRSFLLPTPFKSSIWLNQSTNALYIQQQAAKKKQPWCSNNAHLRARSQDRSTEDDKKCTEVEASTQSRNWRRWSGRGKWKRCILSIHAHQGSDCTS